MGVFTLPLKEVLDLEHDAGNGFRIGLSDYPIFDGGYRNGLNRKIINHFYNREIGLETISLFQFNLRRKMWEIMPLYNQVYLSTKIEFDPLATYDLETVINGTAETEASGESNTANAADSNANSRSVNSEFPQSQLSKRADYATNANDGESKSHSEGNSLVNNTSSESETQNRTSRTRGFQGAAADLLMKYRATLINTDMMIVNELNELFMPVYDTGDELLPDFGPVASTWGFGRFGYGW